MPLGLSLGFQKQKSKSETKVDKLETTNQTGQSTTASSGTNTTTGSTSQTGSSTGQTSTSQQGTTAQQAQTAGQSSQISQLFSDDTLSGLEGAVGHLLGNVGAPLTQVGSFDPTQFIEQGLASARNLQGQTLEDSVNQLASKVGGTAGSNSAMALLSNRLHGDAAANLAGIESQLTGQAQEIVRANALAGNTIDATGNDLLSNILQSLKGGVSATTGTEEQVETQTGQTSATGQTNVSEQTNQQQQTQSTETQQLVQILNQLLSGTVHTVGTENTKGTGTKIGGGASASM